MLRRIRTSGLDAAKTCAGGGVSSVQLQNEVVFVKGQAIVAACGGCVRLAQQFGNVATAETIYFAGRSFAGRFFDRLFGAGSRLVRLGSVLGQRLRRGRTRW